MDYRAEAASLEGFIQQLAVGYLARGYWFYVVGVVPSHKDPCAADEKLISRYGVAISKFERARRKARGLANVQYLRYRERFVLLATPGEHRFFREESDIRDCRVAPLVIGDYALGYRGGHAQVRIERAAWKGRVNAPKTSGVQRRKVVVGHALRLSSSVHQHPGGAACHPTRNSPSPTTSPT